MSQTLSFPCAGTRKRRPRSWIRELSRQANNTRSWHFKMFQINGDANSKVRKKHVKERIMHSSNARNIRRDCRGIGGDSISKE